MQPTTSRTLPTITCDGTGVVSHAGTVLLAELADRIGLTALLNEATGGLRESRAGHDPGRVLVDVAVAIADGAVSISDVQALADQQGLHGPAGSVALTTTIRRVLAGIDLAMLASIRLARATARDRAWTARGELTGTELPGSRAAVKSIEEVVIDLDTTLVTAHSDKDDAKGSFKGGFGHHPLRAWLDNTNEALAMLLRPGNAGRNAAADHLLIVDHALTQIPELWRSMKVLIRADGAGYSHALPARFRRRGWTSPSATRSPKRSAMPSRSSPPTPGPRRTTPTAPCVSTPTSSRSPACSTSAAGPARVPGCASSSAASTRTPARRWTRSRSATATATKRSPPTPPAGHSRSWRHAIARTPVSRTGSPTGKDTGIGHLPSRHAHINTVWIELALIAADLLTLAQSMLLTDEPDLYRAEPKTLRDRLLHIAARITRGQRKVFLRLAEHWPWALALARAFGRLRQIPLPA